MEALQKTMNAVAGIEANNKKQIGAKLGAALSTAQAYQRLLEGDLKETNKKAANIIRQIKEIYGDVNTSLISLEKYKKEIRQEYAKITSKLADLNDFPEAQKILKTEAEGLEEFETAVNKIDSLFRNVLIDITNTRG